MEYNINETFNTIKNIDEIELESLAKNLYFNPNHTIYVCEDNEFLGAINYKSFLNSKFDKRKMIDSHYPFVLNTEIKDIEKTILKCRENGVFVLPIIKDGQIIKEFELIAPQSVFSMDENRWTSLYYENSKFSDFVNHKKYNKLFLIGSYAKLIQQYLKNQLPNLSTSVIEDNYEEFLKLANQDGCIIDVDAKSSELKLSLINCQKFALKSNRI